MEAHAEHSIGAVKKPAYMDPVRRCFLVEPIAEELNDIPLLDPVKRIILLGRIVHGASQGNEAIRNMVIKTKCIESLHHEAASRARGDVEFPAALSPTLNPPSSREVARV